MFVIRDNSKSTGIVALHLTLDEEYPNSVCLKAVDQRGDEWFLLSLGPDGLLLKSSISGDVLGTKVEKGGYLKVTKEETSE